MADAPSPERLQPSLLDRLTDDQPDRQQESRDKRVLSPGKLRECVLRDLSWLLNTCHLEALEDLEPYPEVARSVVNFGIPDLTGRPVSNLDLSELERTLRQAIWDFEPRLVRKTLRVRAIARADGEARNALVLEIQGELWGQPMPQRLYVKTEIDLETGSVALADTARPGGR